MGMMAYLTGVLVFATGLATGLSIGRAVVERRYQRRRLDTWALVKRDKAKANTGR